jgi:hypothetical protein
MANPLFHQMPRDTLFLKNGNAAVTEGMQAAGLQGERGGKKRSARWWPSHGSWL